ncbi:hypothetical protein HY3_12230 [Hyphomonas pacifica]|uniref:Uncharacterized protein n=1 Tax=Hyphomonas pacifica TaxID=1280941 RepID=A0A062U4Z2_9PROT|nr:hypothetical protein HY2_12130 [Hyphomonas pacifica]RAN33664.1 hypothetical protein HY3_12230 [Hyphomonas pacifica]RAN35565.1 hypothetical protein HY11_13740 [Hyphomonas pacifica]
MPEGGKSRKARNAGLSDAGNSFMGWNASPLSEQSCILV